MNNLKPSITLCMIVKDEENNLSNCINSIKPQIDEIIIVDTGSKDKTVQIAKNLGAKVYNFVWDNNFSAARNFALQQATSDWVLILDADHVFVSKSHDDLKKCLEQEKYLGFMIDEHNLDDEKKINSTDRLLFFKNHCGFTFSGLVYEHPMNSIRDYADKNKINVPYGKLENCWLDHLNHVQKIEKLKQKLKIINSAIKREPDNFQYVFKKLHILQNLKKVKEFEKVLLKAVFDIEKKKPEMSESVVGIWGQFGEWILKDDNTNHVEHFYNGAKKLNKKTKFNDIRLVWPYVKISIIQKNYNKAIKDLTLCIKNGIVPHNVSISKEEKITPVYQLLKLVNEEKALEDFATLVLDLPEILVKSGIGIDEVLEVLKLHDYELYESIQDILGQFYDGNDNSSKNGIRLNKRGNSTFISLCMIIKNEQDNIDRCLQSVKGIVDEIVIVDTGSDDKSIQKAEKYGAHIIKSKWNDDFSEARNLALDSAKGKWVLKLDADEELNLSTKEKIKSILKKTKADGLNIIVRNYQPEDELVSHLDVHQVRIFRNKKIYRFRNKVNEQIIPSIAEAGGAFTESLVIINNYGSISKNNKRHKRVISFYHEGLKDHPEDASLLFKMGETYKSLNKWDKAEQCYSKAISNPWGNISNEIKEIIYLRLAQISLANDKYKNSKKYATACLRFNKQNAMAKYILAVTYMYIGHTNASVLLFLELKRTQNIHGLDLTDVDAYLETLERKVNEEEKVMN